VPKSDLVSAANWSLAVLLNGSLIETSNGCSWLTRPPGITANFVLDFLTVLFIATITCELNWSHTKRAGFFRRPLGRFYRTFRSHSFVLFSSVRPLAWIYKIPRGILSLSIVFSFNFYQLRQFCAISAAYLNNNALCFPVARSCNRHRFSTF
jgi:hypothetical protein